MSGRVRKIDHIAVAVRDLAAARRALTAALGLVETHAERLEDRALDTAFLRVGDVDIELIESLADDTPIARFIAKRGPGVHHVCLEVDDLDAVLARCRDAGLEVAGGAEAGARGKRVAFLHPRSTGGLLVELSEG